MAHPSDARLLVLHALRLKGFAEPEAVAGNVGLDPGEVETIVKELGDAQLAVHREGRVTGWSLTPAGRAEHAELVRRELDEAGCRRAVEDAYQRFLGINQELLAVCTSWQLKQGDGEQAVNDHTDAAYDQQVIAKLIDIHDRVRPVTVDLRACLERFGRYGTRLREAVEKVADGQHEWFTKPMIDSYHTIWFELHEDLLATLGIERTQEAQG